MKKDKATRERRDKVRGSNPSPVGTQDYPVSDPRVEETNAVEEELEAREKRSKGHGPAGGDE
ncbi:MAG: hypothetical protein ACLFVC_08850 [Opitutales bacterium]